ncbi:MAG: hypothetical protein ACLFU4_07675 [Opitutales bacterium]
MESENLAVARVLKITGLSDAQLEEAEAAFRVLGNAGSLVNCGRGRSHRAKAIAVVRDHLKAPFPG